MSPRIKKHFEAVLSHLYINPLEKCNLRCKICYTRKTDPVLSESEILEFIKKYQKFHPLQTLTFCGGEVFSLAYFPKLINTLIRRNLLIQIITNGTIDRLKELKQPNSINLIVSLDGLAEYHDANRGPGSFQKAIEFLKKANRLGFHCEIFSIVTRQNFRKREAFERKLIRELGFTPKVTYHPRKPPAYLLHHPVSNVFGVTKKFDFLTDGQMRKIVKERNVFPPRNLGCYQIALASDGQVYGCCEGTTSLGTKNDPVDRLMKKLKERLITWERENTLKNCLGCSQPDFMCGIKYVST